MQYVAVLTARWSKLAPAARTTLACVALTLLALSIGASVLSRQPRVALFANPLHPEQLAEVEERLAGWGVGFTPTADNVIVDARRRNDLLLRCAMAGVPHAHVETTGEALANVGALTPQSVIDAQTRAGLAGDIEAGLRGIDGVDDARVIVAPAKPAEFADETERRASASVRVRTRAGAHLSRAAVAGIRAFVAASVPELDPAGVTIVDDSGAALSNDAGPSSASDLQSSLQGALDAAFGEGATIVRVRTEYAGDRISQRDVRRTPAAGPAIESGLRSERYADGPKRYSRDERNDDRGSETHETVVDTPPGALRRISTAVFVDRTRVPDADAVRALAAAAVGYDSRRGDTLAVAAVDFHHVAEARNDGWLPAYGAALGLVPAIVAAVAAVLIVRCAIPPLAGALRPLVERLSVERASRSVAGLEPARVRSALLQEPPHAAAAVISALPAATAAAVLDLYPPHERDAIVRRMQRPHAPILRDARELLRHHA